MSDINAKSPPVARKPLDLPDPPGLLKIGAFFLRTDTQWAIKSRRVFLRNLIDSGFRFPELRQTLQDLTLTIL